MNIMPVQGLSFRGNYNPITPDIELSKNPKKIKTSVFTNLKPTKLVKHPYFWTSTGLMIAGYYTNNLIKKYYPKYISTKKIQIDPNLEFKEAKTLDEAIKFGKKHLKIKKYVNFTEKDVEIANWVNRGILETSKAMGGKLNNIRNIEVVELKTKDTYAFTKHVLGSHAVPNIYVNRTFIKNLDKDIAHYLASYDKIPPYILKENYRNKINARIQNYKNKENSALIDKLDLYHNLVLLCDNADLYTKPLLISSIIKTNKYQKKLIEEGILDAQNPNIIRYLDKNINLNEKNFDKKLSPTFFESLSNTIIKISGYKIKEEYLLPSKCIIHELGHLNHKRIAKTEWNINTTKDYKKFKENWDNNDNNMSIARHVSSYASISPTEFIAETFTGLVSGREFSPEIMNLYKKYNGIIPQKTLSYKM